MHKRKTFLHTRCHSCIVQSWCVCHVYGSVNGTHGCIGRLIALRSLQVCQCKKKGNKLKNELSFIPNLKVFLFYLSTNLDDKS